MSHTLIQSLILIAICHQTKSLLQTDLVWSKQSILPKSYFSTTVKNPVRCSKLCDRQNECVSVSFDVVEQMCYLHNVSTASTSPDSNGRYLYRNVEKPLDGSSDRCRTAELSVPSVHGREDACVAIKAKQEHYETGETNTTPRMLETVMTGLTTSGLEPTTQITESTTSELEPTTQIIGLKTSELETTTGMMNPCKNNQPFDGTICVCEAPLTGQYCENGPRDCSDFGSNGWHDVYPEDGYGKIEIVCFGDRLYVFVAPSGGFSAQYQNSTWLAYKTGFGGVYQDSTMWLANGAYWLGNEAMYRITSGTLSYSLECYFSASGAHVGTYQNFKVANETNDYTIQYSVYSPTGSADQTLQSGRPFSTHDKNDKLCAIAKNTGFWFTDGCLATPPLFGTVQVDGNAKSYANFWASLIRI